MKLVEMEERFAAGEFNKTIFFFLEPTSLIPSILLCKYLTIEPLL